MSMRLITLILAVAFCQTNAEDQVVGEYPIKGTECGQEAHEIGGIVGNHKMQLYGFGTDTQQAFQKACEAAKDYNGDTSKIFLKPIPEGHGSEETDQDKRICCMSRSVCSVEPLLIGNKIQTCLNDETCGKLNEKYRCTGEIPDNSEKKVCCLDDSVPLCPNGDRAEDACNGDDTKCNKERFIQKGHSCRKSDLKYDQKTYCCAVRDEDKCPGSFDPFASKESGNSAPDCDHLPSEFGYKWPKTNAEATYMCCPRLKNRNFGWENLEVILEPERAGQKPKECTKNSECGEFEFCDVVRHAKLNNINSEKSFCFADPVYIGKTVKLAEGKGLVGCKKDADCGGEGKICSASMGLKFPPMDRFIKSVKADNASIHHVCFQLDKCNEQSMNQEKLTNLVEGLAGDEYPEITNNKHRDSEETSYTKISAKDHKGGSYKDVTLSCAWKNGDARAVCSKAQTVLAPAKRLDDDSTVVVTCKNDTDCTRYEFNAMEQQTLCIRGKKSDQRGVCCLASYCPNTNLQLRKQIACKEDKECGEIGIATKATTGVCTKDEASEKKHCCPKMKDAGYSSLAYKTLIPCNTLSDCLNNPIFQGVKSLLFCAETEGQNSTCAHIGFDSKVRSFSTTCTSNAECKADKYQGVCAQTPQGVQLCHEDPFQLLQFMESRVKAKWRNMSLGCAGGSILCAVIALLLFLKYRSRHLFDRFKKSKDKKEESSEKTEKSKTEKSKKDKSNVDKI